MSFVLSRETEKTKKNYHEAICAYFICTFLYTSETTISQKKISGDGNGCKEAWTCVTHTISIAMSSIFQLHTYDEQLSTFCKKKEWKMILLFANVSLIGLNNERKKNSRHRMKNRLKQLISCYSIWMIYRITWYVVSVVSMLANVTFFERLICIRNSWSRHHALCPQCETSKSKTIWSVYKAWLKFVCVAFFSLKENVLMVGRIFLPNLLRTLSADEFIQKSIVEVT